jgi:hypothetical protein
MSLINALQTSPIELLNFLETAKAKMKGKMLEIVDEMDRVEDMQALARRQWKKRAKGLKPALDCQAETDALTLDKMRNKE